MADGRDVAGSVPCGFDAELFAQDGDLARGREAAGLSDVNADVIDQALGDERGPFMRAVEEFAHRDRGGALLADLAEVSDVFRGERVFHEEQVILLGFLGEHDGLVGRDALVHVVQQIDLVAQLHRGPASNSFSARRI